jgi:NAD(P)H-flavin reductase
MTTNTAWWNLPIEELEQMADDKGNIKLNTKIKATNPYSGQSAMLTPDEHKLYIEIKTAEFDEDYNTMQKKLSKFSRLNASAYMVLLD